MGNVAAKVRRLNWEFWVGAAVTALAVIGLALVPSQVLEPKFGTRSIAFSPKAFPIITLSTMALAAATMAVSSLFAGEEKRDDMPEGALRPAVLTAMLIMLAYVSLLEFLGTFITTALAVASLSWLFGSRWITALCLALAVPSFIWITFKIGLKVFLPEGSLLEGVL